MQVFRPAAAARDDSARQSANAAAAQKPGGEPNHAYGPRVPVYATTVYEHAQQVDADVADDVINDAAAAELEGDTLTEFGVRDSMPMPEAGSVSTGVTAPPPPWQRAAAPQAGKHAAAQWGAHAARDSGNTVAVPADSLAALLQRLDRVESSLEQATESAAAQVRAFASAGSMLPCSPPRLPQTAKRPCVPRSRLALRLKIQARAGD